MKNINILLICIVLLAGCSSTGQRYHYCNKTFNENGSLLSVEECSASTHHRNKFTKKSADSIASECSVEQVRTTAKKYGAEIQSDAIEATEKPIGAMGTAVGNVVSTATGNPLAIASTVLTNTTNKESDTE